MARPLIVQPEAREWPGLVQRQPDGMLLGRSLREWREVTRRELGLPTDRPLIATGHQTLLWHPGILAKFLVAHAVASPHGYGLANLVVDQHADGFGDFDVPVRRADGSLVVRRLELCRPAPRKDVPMGRHEAFTPPRPPNDLRGAVPSVAEGVPRIFEAVYANRFAPNAAIQMAQALENLMSPWVRGGVMPHVTATDLLCSSLGRAMQKEMARDPWRCAACYNQAVSAVPEAGMAPLLIRDDYVELPLWRVRDDGRRMRAYDNDVDPANANEIDLLPRALLMTAIARLGMCDLFIHGTGGAVYDRAMEIWIREWLGVETAPMAVVTANLRLPLGVAAEMTVEQAQREHRRLWHHPPGCDKRQLLAAVEGLPRNSSQRRVAYLTLHERLEQCRAAQRERIDAAQRSVEQAKRDAADLEVAARRDWAFPLYPKELIDQLAEQAARGV